MLLKKYHAHWNVKAPSAIAQTGNLPTASWQGQVTGALRAVLVIFVSQQAGADSDALPDTQGLLALSARVAESVRNRLKEHLFESCTQTPIHACLRPNTARFTHVTVQLASCQWPGVL